jgi:hypothetical protein
MVFGTPSLDDYVSPLRLNCSGDRQLQLQRPAGIICCIWQHKGRSRGTAHIERAFGQAAGTQVRQ